MAVQEKGRSDWNRINAMMIRTPIQVRSKSFSILTPTDEFTIFVHCIVFWKIAFTSNIDHADGV